MLPRCMRLVDVCHYDMGHGDTHTHKHTQRHTDTHTHYNIDIHGDRQTKRYRGWVLIKY